MSAAPQHSHDQPHQLVLPLEMPLNYFSLYVGIPTVKGGRSHLGVDCYGLLWLVYRETWGIELPPYDEKYASPLDRAMVQKIMRDEINDHDEWSEIELGDARQGDALLILSLGSAIHIGLVLGRRLLLHSPTGGESIIEDYTQTRLNRVIVGAYRHERFST